MMIESTDFNQEYWSRFTQEEFIKQCMRDGIFQGFSDREQMLKLAYQLLTDDYSRNAETAYRV
jgi:hypothetical protein